MNAEETGKVCALVANVCPQQQMVPADPTQNEPGTAAYWWPLLEDLRYPDAVLAVQRLAKKQRFIAPSEIIAMVATIRAERLDAMPQNKRPAPNVDPADVRRYAAGVRAIERAIADGEIKSDGDGGYVLASARWQQAITAGPGAQAIERSVDYSEVFSERRAALRAKREDGEQERTARAVEAAERQRQLDALAHMIEGYEKTRAGKLARKRKLGKRITKPLAVVADDGATMEEPQAERDAAAS